MKVDIIGTGYVGLVTGVGLSAKGHIVTCYDINKDIINSINSGTIPFYEENLEKLMNESISQNKFNSKLISHFSNNFDGDIIIIAVGTPTKNGQINLKYIEETAKQIGAFLKESNKFISIIIKSTVLPGTTDTLVKSTIEKYSGKKFGEFGLGMNPEFLREGNAVEDFMFPDRIVIGYEDNRTLILLKNLYEPWDKCEKVYVNSRTAEMIKYANNALLAVQISASNELANIASSIDGVDYMDVLEGVKKDKRWSPIVSKNERIYPDILDYLIPGCGFGGSCFPKDVKALKSLAENNGLSPKILSAVLSVNDKQPEQIISILKKVLGKIAQKKIFILGLSFKSGTDDIRESISIKIIKLLLKENATVFANDPIAMDNAKGYFKNYNNFHLISDWKNSLSNIDSVVITTNWVDYKYLSNLDSQGLLKNKVIVDTRRLFNPDDFIKNKYVAIGRSLNQGIEE